MIEIRDAVTHYADRESFYFHNITFEEGRITSVIGRNGCGKSTLLKMIVGLRPYKGAVMIDGQQSRLLSGKERSRKVSYLPQNLKSVNIDVGTLVSHGRYAWQSGMRRMSAKDFEKLDQALAITGMTEYRNKNLSELSGGERQRAYLAMVVAQDTPMILLDEPTTYMDVTVQKTFFDVLRKLSKEGHGIVMVSHHLEQSFSYSDRICLIHDKTALFSGTPDELADNGALLQKVFGMRVKRSNDADLLYPYTAIK